VYVFLLVQLSSILQGFYIPLRNHTFTFKSKALLFFEIRLSTIDSIANVPVPVKNITFPSKQPAYFKIEFSQYLALSTLPLDCLNSIMNNYNNANSNEVLKQNNQVPLSLMSAIQLPHQSQLNKTYLNQTEVSQPQGNPNYNIFRKQN
jgi:hypothetical protein